MTPLLAAAIEQVRRDVDGTVHVVREQGDIALLLVIPPDYPFKERDILEMVVNIVKEMESLPNDELVVPDLSAPHMRLLDVRRFNFSGSTQ